MRTFDWRAKDGAGDAHYLSAAAEEVAGHRLHILEECQSLVKHPRMVASRFAKALRQKRGSSDGMMHDCAHVFSMAPLQSACREYGVKAATPADGDVVQEDRRMVMPWEEIMKRFGKPSAGLKYKVFVMRDNFGM